MRNLSLAGILVAALMIAGCGNSNPSSFGFTGSANASVPQFLQVGKTYRFGGFRKATIIEIDKQSGWIKVTIPNSNSNESAWINLAQVEAISDEA